MLFCRGCSEKIFLIFEQMAEATEGSSHVNEYLLMNVNEYLLMNKRELQARKLKEERK